MENRVPVTLCRCEIPHRDAIPTRHVIPHDDVT